MKQSKMLPSHLRSCARTAKHLQAVNNPTKMTTETTAGTSTTEPIVMMTLPVMTVLEMMAATGAAATMMSAQVLRSSAVGS
jgi:hypothetical protein